MIALEMVYILYTPTFIGNTSSNVFTYYKIKLLPVSVRLYLSNFEYIFILYKYSGSRERFILIHAIS